VFSITQQLLQSEDPNCTKVGNSERCHTCPCCSLEIISTPFLSSVIAVLYPSLTPSVTRKSSPSMPGPPSSQHYFKCIDPSGLVCTESTSIHTLDSHVFEWEAYGLLVKSIVHSARAARIGTVSGELRNVWPIRVKAYWFALEFRSW
jgi:hypothetical protein